MLQLLSAAINPCACETLVLSPSCHLRRLLDADYCCCHHAFFFPLHGCRRLFPECSVLVCHHLLIPPAVALLAPQFFFGFHPVAAAARADRIGLPSPFSEGAENPGIRGDTKQHTDSIGAALNFVHEQCLPETVL